MLRVRTENRNTVGHWDRMHAKERMWSPGGIVPNIARFIGRGESVLDVGVGQAVVFRQLAQLRPDIVFMGCDFSPRAIEKLQARADLGFKFDRLFVHDIREPLPGPIADVVVSTEVLEHLDHPKLAVRHMVALARRRVIVTVPFGSAIADPDHLWEFEAMDIRNLLKSYGSVFVRDCRGGRNLLGVVTICHE